MKPHTVYRIGTRILALAVLMGSPLNPAAMAAGPQDARPLTIARAEPASDRPARVISRSSVSRLTRELRLEAREDLRVRLATDIKRTISDATIVAD